MTYTEKLSDPRWQKKRLQVLNRDGFACTFCGDTKTTLHVHHEKYNKEPWDAELAYLTTLCKHCHLLISTAIKHNVTIISCIKEISVVTKSVIIITKEFLSGSAKETLGFYYYDEHRHIIVGLVSLEKPAIGRISEILLKNSNG